MKKTMDSVKGKHLVPRTTNLLEVRSPIPIDEDFASSMRTKKQTLISPIEKHVHNARPSMTELFDIDEDNNIGRIKNRGSSPRNRLHIPQLSRSNSSPTVNRASPLRRRTSTERLRKMSSQDSEFFNNSEEPNVGLTFVHDNATLRERILDMLQSTGIDRVLDFVQAVFSLIACILYVIQSYDPEFEMNLYVLFIELFIGCFFLFDYLLALFLAENKRNFIFSYISVIDIASIIPVFLDLILFINIQEYYNKLKTERSSSTGISVNTTNNNNTTSTNILNVNNNNNDYNDAYMISGGGEYRLNLNVLRIVRVFRIFRILRGMKWINRNLIHYSHKYIRVVFLFFCIIFCAAGLFQQIEYEQDLTLVDCIYFTVVTLTTLGYGDVKPLTAWGRVFIVLLMMGVSVLIPNQITKLNELRKKEHANKKFKTISNNGHILLCGNLSPNSLLSFLHEIYGMTHGKQDLPLCILSPVKASPLVKSIVKGRWLRDRVTVLVGSALSVHDLERCMIRDSVACFLIAETNASDQEREDTKIVLGATNIRKLNNTVPIFACVLGGKESTQRLEWAVGDHTGSHAFSYGLVRQFLVGTNIKCPGAAPLISNLLRSYSLPSLREEEVAKNKRLEYQWGVGFEIYPMKLGIKFHDRLFSSISKIVYSHFGAIFIGLGRNVDGNLDDFTNLDTSNADEEPIHDVMLNPYNEKIKRNDIGYFIARGALHISQIDNHFTKAALLYGQHGPGFISSDFLAEQNASTADFRSNRRLRAKVADKSIGLYTPGRPSSKSLYKKEQSYRLRNSSADGTNLTALKKTPLKNRNTLIGNIYHKKKLGQSLSNGINKNDINDSIELQAIDVEDLNLSFVGEEALKQRDNNGNNTPRRSFELDTRENTRSSLKTIPYDVENPLFNAKQRVMETYNKEHSRTIAVVEHRNSPSPSTMEDLQIHEHHNVKSIFGKMSPARLHKKKGKRKKKRTSIEIVDDIDLLRDNGKIINLHQKMFEQKMTRGDGKNDINQEIVDVSTNGNEEKEEEEEEAIPVSLLSLKAMSLYRLRDLNLSLKGRSLQSAIVKHVEFKNHIVVSCQCRVAGIFHIISRLRLKNGNVDNDDLKDNFTNQSFDAENKKLKKKRKDKNVDKILIMSKYIPTEEEWELLAHFPEIYWFSGDANNYRDRLKTSCHLASNIIILYHGPIKASNRTIRSNAFKSLKAADVETEEENERILDIAQLDFDRISTLIGFHELKSSSYLTIELKHTSNHKFMKVERALGKDTKTSSLEKLFYSYFKETTHFMSPLYAAGKIISSSLTERAVAQSWYNSQVIGVFHALVGLDEEELFQRHTKRRRSVKYMNGKVNKDTGGLYHQTKNSLYTGKNASNDGSKSICRMMHLPIPKDFIGCTFAELFNFLIEEEHVIPLGLFRNGRFKGRLMETKRDRKQILPYVYTCPVRDSKVKKYDSVIVLK